MLNLLEIGSFLLCKLVARSWAEMGQPRLGICVHPGTEVTPGKGQEGTRPHHSADDREKEEGPPLVGVSRMAPLRLLPLLLGFGILSLVFISSFIEILFGHSFNTKTNQVFWNTDLNFLIFVCVTSGVGLMWFVEKSTHLLGVGLVSMWTVTATALAVLLKEFSRSFHQGPILFECQHKSVREENKSHCVMLTIGVLVIRAQILLFCWMGTVCVTRIWKEQKRVERIRSRRSRRLHLSSSLRNI